MRITSPYPAGFTLIELMIVVVIVGILAAIAYPSYQSQIQSTRRADGQVRLMDIMSAQERFFSARNTYTTNLTNLGYGTATNVPSEGGWYQITATACTGATIANCVLLTAAPQGSQAPAGADLKLPKSKDRQLVTCIHGGSKSSDQVSRELY